MQQFVVPQFIDVEDKIIGPITVRQFIILLAGSGIAFIAYKLSDFALFVFEFAVIAFATFGIAFIRVNGRPIHYLFLNVIQTARRPKVRVWGKTISTADLKVFMRQKEPVVPVIVKSKNKARSSRLAELSLIVDTGGVYQGEALPIPESQKV